MTERRHFIRWQINRQAKLKFEGAEAFCNCLVYDVNFKGLRISLGYRLALDKFLKVNIVLAEDFILEIEAWVVWHKRFMEANIYGLYFTRIKDSDKERIYQFVRRDFPEEISKQCWKGLEEKGGEGMLKPDFEDRRIFERFPVDLPLKFVDLYANKEGEAEVCDISAKGMGLVAKEPLKPNATLEMWLSLADTQEPLYARGAVVWSKPTVENRYRVGVSLEKADLMGLAKAIRKP